MLTFGAQKSRPSKTLLCPSRIAWTCLIRPSIPIWMAMLLERLQATSPGPLQPRLEQHERVSGGDAVDLPELLGEQVGAVQALVGLLDRRELELLAVGQVAGVLPQHEAGALQLLGELFVTCLARLVPDLTADLVQRVGRCLD